MSDDSIPADEVRELIKEWEKWQQKALDDNTHGYAGGISDSKRELKELLEDHTDE